MLNLGILLSYSGDVMAPTAIEVDPNRAEFVLHPKGERLHECNVTIKPHTNELDAIRWNRSLSRRMQKTVNGRTGIITICGEGAFKNKCTQSQALRARRAWGDRRRGCTIPTGG